MNTAPLVTRRRALALTGITALTPAWAQPAPGWRLLYEHALPAAPKELQWSHDGQHLNLWWPGRRWARLEPGKGPRLVEPLALPPPMFGDGSWAAYLWGGPAESFHVADVAPDRRTVAVGGGAGELDLWALSSPPRRIGPLFGPGREGPEVSAVRFSADGKSVLAGFGDGQVRRIDVGSRRVLATFQAAMPIPAPPGGAPKSSDPREDPAVIRLEPSPNGRWWVVCTSGGLLSTLRADTLAPTALARAWVGDGWRQQIDFTEDSRVVLLRDSDRNTLQARAPGLARAVGRQWRLPFPTSAPWTTSVTGKLVALHGGRDHDAVWVANFLDGSPKAVLPSLGQPIRSMAFSPEGRHLLTLTADGEARVWQARSKPYKAGDRLRTAQERQLDPDPWPEPGSLVAMLPVRFEQMALSADGKWVVAGGADGELLAFDRAKAHAVAHRQKAHVGGVSAMSLYASGGLVATAGYDLRLRVWRVPGA